MAYTTTANIRSATGFNNAANISDATITAYIADADGVINGSIAKRYALPLAVDGVESTPDVIETISRHITVGLLYANEYGEESQDTDKGWEKRMNWAMKILDKIKSGKLELYNDAGEEYDRNSRREPSFYPNSSSSEVSAVDSTAPKLTMNQEF